MSGASVGTWNRSRPREMPCGSTPQSYVSPRPDVTADLISSGYPGARRRKRYRWPRSTVRIGLTLSCGVAKTNGSIPTLEVPTKEYARVAVAATAAARSAAVLCMFHTGVGDTGTVETWNVAAVRVGSKAGLSNVSCTASS